jgi:hypothetical protein
MRFVVFVKSNAQSEAGMLPDEKALSAMGSYNEALIRAGAMLAGEGLKPRSQGARVRALGGKSRVVDGPFAEAKELVGGYWVLQFSSREEAIARLEQAPFPRGEIEIRPLYEPEDFALPEGEPVSAAQRTVQETPGKTPAQQPRIAGTKRYLSLLKADAYTEGGDEPTAALMQEMGALIQEMAQQGVLLSGEGLKPSREGFRMSYDGPRPHVIDGPFTESKELIAGVSLLQTRTLAEAVEWSRRCLEIHMRGVGASEGEIEVRPLFEIEDFPVDPSEQPDGWRALETSFRDRGHL